jgi:hypothetical protein
VSLTLRYYPYVVGDGASTVRDLIASDPRSSFRAHVYFGNNGRHQGVSVEHLKAIPAVDEVVRLSFIGSIRVGGLYRDGRRYITDALSERFDAIARSMPEFHFGRFDIRFKSIDSLQTGEDFLIIEINGAGSEAIHIWDPEVPVSTAHREIFRYQAKLFAIGAKNRARGYRPVTLREFYRFTRRQQRLLTQYPVSV